MKQAVNLQKLDSNLEELQDFYADAADSPDPDVKHLNEVLADLLGNVRSCVKRAVESDGP